jgi:putative sterol carrier protein
VGYSEASLFRGEDDEIIRLGRVKKMAVKQVLDDVVTQFNAKVVCDDSLRKELAGIKKRVQIDLGPEQYYFILDDCKVEGICVGSVANPDITIISDDETFRKLHCKEMKIMKAWALKKIRVKGSLEDIMRLRKFF